MDLVKSAHRHTSWLSETIYILLNVSLALVVFLTVHLELLALAYAAVVLSKWRVFAVRPRYWWDNIQTNLLDMLFGVSIVSFLWQIQSAQGGRSQQELLFLQGVIVVIYIAWLLFLKPRSGRVAVLSQALVAQFMAIAALFSVAYTLPAWVAVAAMWIVGYIAARHALNTYEETDVTLLSLLWGFVVAELGWLAYHWTIAYSIIFTNAAFQIPQVAIIVSLLSFFSAQAYTLYKDTKKFQLSDIVWPGVFSGGLILVVLLFFNGYQG